MEKKLRTNLYNQTDSSIAFLLGLIVPQVLILLAVFLACTITGAPMVSTETQKGFMDLYPTAYSIMCALVPQLGFLITFFIVSERRKVNYVKANQFNFKINILVLVVVLVIGAVALVGFNPLVSMFDAFAEKLGYVSSVSNIDVSTTGKFIGTIFYIALLPAICEELIFRGIITNGVKKYGIVVAVVVSSVLFALMHQNLQQLIYQLFLGAVMAYIALKTGSIIYTMVLHFLNNFIILLAAHLNWGKEPPKIDYTNAWNVIYPILMVIASVAIIVGLLALMNFIIKKFEARKLKKQQLKQINVEADELQKNAQTHLKQQDLELKQRELGIKQDKVELKQENIDISKENIVEELDIKRNAESKTIASDVRNSNKKESVKNLFKNAIFVTAIVTGVVYWIFSVVSGFISK